MLQRLKEYFISPSKITDYKPVKHTFFRDNNVTDQLHEVGYYVADFLGEKERLLLLELYEKNHDLKDNRGGAFFGIFSKDITYRNKIHDSINQILDTCFNRWFKNFKSAVNTFVIKVPGASGQVPIHQDGAAIDELEYSSINIWIPLQEINETNSALHIIPRSHHIFLPYRCATVEPIQKNIDNELYRYFKPIYLKLGQVLFFDSRMFHYSPPNLSEHNRVIVVCRICPIEADIVAYYKESGNPKSSVEMWRCPDDYLIYSDGYNDNLRPEGCELITCKKIGNASLTVEEFERRRIELGISPNGEPMIPKQTERNFIQEPLSNL